MNKMLMAGLMSMVSASAISATEDINPFERKSKSKGKTSHKNRSKQKQARASRKKNRR